MSIYDTFKNQALKLGSKKALIINNESLSYEALLKEVDRVTSLFVGIGLKEDDKLLIMLKNSKEFVVALLAASKIGLTLVPLNSSLSTKGVQKAIDVLDAKYLLTTANNIKKLSKLKDLNFICTNKELENSYFFYKTVMEKNINENVDIDKSYILTMTSGSTGDPKPIIFSQKTKVDRAFLSVKNIYGLNEDDVIIASTPIYHSLAQRQVLLPLMIGATSVVLEHFTPKKWLEYVEKEKVTFSMITSSQVVQILNELKQKSYDIKSLKIIVSSSALLRDDVKSEAIKYFDADFHEIYGASEVGTVTNLYPKDTDKLKSVGKALPYVDIKIVDENGKSLKNGEIGEIVCKTKTAFLGYFNLDEKTKESFLGEYFKTGDLGYLDEEGYLYYAGRKKEMINVMGINVYPKDIEEVILSCSGVKECAVIGVEDEYLGEAILAVISGDSIDEKEIKLRCLEELADFQQPHGFVFLDELPKNAMAKIVKKELNILYKDYKINSIFKNIRR